MLDAPRVISLGRQVLRLLVFLCGWVEAGEVGGIEGVGGEGGADGFPGAPSKAPTLNSCTSSR